MPLIRVTHPADAFSTETRDILAEEPTTILLDIEGGAHYPVAARYRGPRMPPRLRPGTAAWQFRTRIRAAATQPPNFAGHYVLATWGCGLECVSYAIIDVKTGAVFFDDRTVCCWGTAVPADFEPVRGQLGSRLLICTGQLNEQGLNKAHYYTFHKGRLAAVP